MYLSINSMYSYGGLLLLGSANMADRWLQSLSMTNTYHQQSRANIYHWIERYTCVNDGVWCENVSVCKRV